MIKLQIDDDIISKISSVGQTFPMHTHDFYEYFLVTRGKALHVINNEVQVIERGSFVLVRPSDEHGYDYYKTQDFAMYNSGFSVEVFNSLNSLYFGKVTPLTTSKLPKHIKLEEDKLCHLEQLLIKLESIKSESNQKIFFSLMLSYATYLMMTKDDYNPDDVIPDWLICTLDEMSKPENFIIGLPRLLEISNYSQEHLNREFKKHLKTTPTRYINDLRLRYAHLLLTTTDIPIVKVCGACGFNNLSHFYSEFKKFFKYSPSKVRTLVK